MAARELGLRLTNLLEGKLRNWVEGNNDVRGVAVLSKWRLRQKICILSFCLATASKTISKKTKKTTTTEKKPTEKKNNKYTKQNKQIKIEINIIKTRNKQTKTTKQKINIILSKKRKKKHKETNKQQKQNKTKI